MRRPFHRHAQLPVVTMRFSAPQRLAAAAIAIVLAGCSLLPTPDGIQVTIPAAPEVPALPVTIVDNPGIVRQAAPANDAPSDLSSTSIEAVPGRDDAIRVAWLGGQCADRATVTINPVGDRFRVAVEELWSAWACSAVGLRRSIVLELVEPVGADAFGTF